MKKPLLYLAAFGLLAFLGISFLPADATLKKKSNALDLKEGDLIFQALESELSMAIQLATKSKYSHCGILCKIDDAWFVFEALQPVQLTPLKEWTERGQDGHYVVKRLKQDEMLSDSVLLIMKRYGEKQRGKNYDIYFNWSDDRMYCSELIWKIYKTGTGLEIGKLQKLREFDLSSPEVKAMLKQCYGDKVPLDEPVISPVSVFNSSLLEEVISR